MNNAHSIEITLSGSDFPAISIDGMLAGRHFEPILTY
jgi:hypothetical protein